MFSVKQSIKTIFYFYLVLFLCSCVSLQPKKVEDRCGILSLDATNWIRPLQKLWVGEFKGKGDATINGRDQRTLYEHGNTAVQVHKDEISNNILMTVDDTQKKNLITTILFVTPGASVDLVIANLNLRIVCNKDDELFPIRIR